MIGSNLNKYSPLSKQALEFRNSDPWSLLLLPLRLLHFPYGNIYPESFTFVEVEFPWDMVVLSGPECWVRPGVQPPTPVQADGGRSAGIPGQAQGGGHTAHVGGVGADCQTAAFKGVGNKM